MTVRHPCPEAPGPLEAYAQRFDDGFDAGPAPGFPGVPAGAAVAPRPEQDPDGARRDGAGRGGAAPSRPAIAVLPVGGHLGRGRRSTRAPGGAPGRPRHPAPRRWGARRGRHGGPEGRHQDRPRRPAVPGGPRQGGQRHRGRDQPMGRRAGVLPAPRRAVHPGATPAQRQARPGLPHQAPHRGRVGGRAGGPACPSGRRWPTASTATTTRSRGVAPGPSALRARPQALEGGVGARGRRPATPEEVARRQRWEGPTRSGERSGDWARVVRRYRDGHREVWWATEPRFAGYQPEGPVRLVVATTDPTTLPHLTTWYLATNLPRPDGAPGAAAPFAPPTWRAIVRLYGLRNWVEQGYKQVKREARLGRLPGPHGPRHPPPLGPRWLRLLLLLAGLVHYP